MATSGNFYELMDKASSDISEEFERINKQAMKDGIGVGLIRITDKMALESIEPINFWNGMGVDKKDGSN